MSACVTAQAVCDVVRERGLLTEHATRLLLNGDAVALNAATVAAIANAVTEAQPVQQPAAVVGQEPYGWARTVADENYKEFISAEAKRGFIEANPNSYTASIYTTPLYTAPVLDAGVQGDGELHTALTVFDMGLGFALCHRDFGDTRAAIKQLQRDFDAIRAMIGQQAATVQPDSGRDAALKVATLWDALDSRFVSVVENHPIFTGQVSRAFAASNPQRYLDAAHLRAALAAQPAPSSDAALVAEVVDNGGKRFCMLMDWDALPVGTKVYLAAHPANGAQVGDTEVLSALTDVLDEYDRNTCAHESTKRGGAIWTICEGCGTKWADDRGGFKPYEDSPKIAAARAILAAAKKGTPP